ncbi:hypothetical protein [Pseudomonas japonica]|uniref:hypothetical protein n=1 Tax=Pseudomonas japonica TaxID=256466 RepID=UPI0015E3BBC7|nr:hypothetical protein [Pseudomonas japonica]MBA1242577.1 hypothetical protein [Pseudomonas japonica]MBA1289235.1 hypothetical protein [Pseudomonas japonica]
MKNIQLSFYHPDLDIISDRTLRSLLKKISTIAKEIQYQEVMYIINNSQASGPEKQSLRDRLKGPLHHNEAYYVEKIERGSLIVTVALSSVALWFLQHTIGESIKEAWLQQQMHRNLVSYLSSPLRKTVVDRNVEVVLGGMTFESYVVEDIEKVVVDENTLMIKIALKTPFRVLKRIEGNPGVMSIDSIIADSEKIIATLDDRI